ncbi:MAG: pilin [Bacteroidota bacterium]
MKTMRKQAGFTLIELMIVIAILAILLAIAVPAYQDYTIRARAAECVNLAASAKVAVSETVQSTGAFPETNETAGWDGASGENCSSVDVGTGGQITAVTSIADAGSLAFTFDPSTRAGAVVWVCSNTGAVRQAHVPAECRTN